MQNGNNGNNGSNSSNGQVSSTAASSGQVNSNLTDILSGWVSGKGVSTRRGVTLLPGSKQLDAMNSATEKKLLGS